MSGDVRELPGAQWAARGTRLLAGLYVWLTLWLALWVLVPTILLPWSPVVVTSGSMGPVVNRGDIVLSTASGLDDLAAGQVITFRRGATDDGELITHRIQSIDTDGVLTTRGDANTDPDSGRLTTDAVVGRARLLIPYAGLPLLWLRGSPLVFAAWLALTSVAFALARAGLPRLDELLDVDGQPVFRPAMGLWSPLDRLLGRLEGAPRPAPGPLRAWSPTVVTALALALLVRSPVQVLMAVLATGLVLLADPRGPHVPIGRFGAGATRIRTGFTDRMLPRVREHGAMLLLPVALTSGLLVAGTPGSDAVFVDVTVADGSVLGSGVWDCPGTAFEVTVIADAGIRSDLPDDHQDGIGGLTLDQTTGQQVLLALPDVEVLPTCAIAGAQLDLTVLATGMSRLRADRLTAGFDGATVTAATAPAVGRTGAVDALALLGTTTLDVTDLIEITGNNLLLRVDSTIDLVPVRVGSLESGQGAVLRVTFATAP